jgi:hypothetical protein
MIYNFLSIYFYKRGMDYTTTFGHMKVQRKMR